MPLVNGFVNVSFAYRLIPDLIPDPSRRLSGTTLPAQRRRGRRSSGRGLFTFEDGRPPHPDTIRQRFDRLAAAAGLSRITFHDRRHSYAISALKAGLKLVQEQMPFRKAVCSTDDEHWNRLISFDCVRQRVWYRTHVISFRFACCAGKARTLGGQESRLPGW